MISAILGDSRCALTEHRVGSLLALGANNLSIRVIIQLAALTHKSFKINTLITAHDLGVLHVITHLNKRLGVFLNELRCLAKVNNALDYFLNCHDGSNNTCANARATNPARERPAGLFHQPLTEDLIQFQNDPIHNAQKIATPAPPSAANSGTNNHADNSCNEQCNNLSFLLFELCNVIRNQFLAAIVTQTLIGVFTVCNGVSFYAISTYVLATAGTLTCSRFIWMMIAKQDRYGGVQDLPAE